jgi:G:T/U-mismatch repair DNA glycosylase
MLQAIMNTIETHPFKPIAPKDATLLIMGSFPGRDITGGKAKDVWFYSTKRNQFWDIISSVYDVE